MSSWNRRQPCYYQVLLEHKVRLSIHQFWSHQAIKFHFINQNIGSEIRENPLFNAYVVDQGSLNGISGYYFNVVCLITGPNKGQYVYAKDIPTIMPDGKYADLNPNTRFAKATDWDDAVYGVDYAVFISFETIKEAMFFKLKYGELE